MKTFLITISILIISMVLFAMAVLANPYKLNFSPSPDETNNIILQYIGMWSPTNLVNGSWINFGVVPVGYTNIPIPVTIPQTCYLAVVAQGTNGLIGSPSNSVLYNAPALAAIYTNVPAPPRPPSAPTITN